MITYTAGERRVRLNIPEIVVDVTTAARQILLSAIQTHTIVGTECRGEHLGPCGPWCAPIRVRYMVTLNKVTRVEPRVYAHYRIGDFKEVTT